MGPQKIHVLKRLHAQDFLGPRVNVMEGTYMIILQNRIFALIMIRYTSPKNYVESGFLLQFGFANILLLIARLIS